MQEKRVVCRCYPVSPHAIVQRVKWSVLSSLSLLWQKLASLNVYAPALLVNDTNQLIVKENWLQLFKINSIPLVFAAIVVYMPKTCVWKEPHSGACLNFPTGRMLRHNELRNLTVYLMSGVCHNVCTEPEQQPLSGEILYGQSANCQDEAEVDIRGDGFC